MNKKEFREYELKFAAFVEKENLNSTHAGELENEFSSRSCDICKTLLAGARYWITGLRKNEKFGIDKRHKKAFLTENYKVCSDCYYYTEYGQLDDMSMIEINESIDPEVKLDFKPVNDTEGLTQDDVCLMAFNDREAGRVYISGTAIFNGLWWDASGNYGENSLRPDYYAKLPRYLN